MQDAAISMALTRQDTQQVFCAAVTRLSPRSHSNQLRRRHSKTQPNLRLHQRGAKWPAAPPQSNRTTVSRNWQTSSLGHHADRRLSTRINLRVYGLRVYDHSYAQCTNFPLCDPVEMQKSFDGQFGILREACRYGQPAAELY